MSYNSFNTRISGRYNTPGRFVSGGELAPGGAVSYGRGNRGHNNGMNNPYRLNQRYYQQQSQQSPQSPQSQQEPQQEPELQPQPQPQPRSPSPPRPMVEPNPALQFGDIEMKTEIIEMKEGLEIPCLDNSRPYWMRTKLSGVKKISNKERRRRQNENLRRLLAPKNALMVLNEMLPGEREVAQFKVEPAPSHPYYNSPTVPSFCAELTVDGVSYKGYGDNKIAARNDAAEQAIRDLIIKRMTKVHSVEGQLSSTTAGGLGEAGDARGAEGEDKMQSGEEEQALPMIQLASFALHKLFAEWECDGHKVPQLKALTPNAVSDAGSEASGTSGAGGGADGAGGSGRVGPMTSRPSKPARAVPAGAASMHPCMLLTYMRPHLEYRELAVDGDRPQNMMFTMGIDVDGTTYVGKATNKREARKQAARAACSTLFGVSFTDDPLVLPVLPAPPAPPAAAPASQE